MMEQITSDQLASLMTKATERDAMRAAIKTVVERARAKDAPDVWLTIVKELLPFVDE